MIIRAKTYIRRVFGKKLPVVVGLLAFLLVLGVFGAHHLVDSPSNMASTKPAHSSGPPSLQLPADFSLEDKIGQLLIVGVSSRATAIELEGQYQIGGFLIRPGSDLFSKAGTSAVVKAGELPPVFAVDEEGGQISRLPNADFSLYSASYMGSLPDAQVQKVAFDMGRAMVAIGANLDFAPVVDLDDGQNAAISQLNRSFSSNQEVVARKAAAFADGLRAAGIVPTFKHFPGLGRATGVTDGDTDTGAAIAPGLPSLEQNDLKPYTLLLRSDLTSTVMVGNQIVPGLSHGLPASLSSASYQLLRTKYGFNQVVFTDELLLAESVSSVDPDPADAVVAAIKVGADMPLIDTDSSQVVGNVIKAVAEAVQSDQIKQSQINASLNRILEMKSSIKKIVPDKREL